MTNKIKVGLGVILITVAAVFIRACNKDGTPPVAFNVPLDPDTTAQVVVQERHIALRTSKDTKAAYIPDGGEAIGTIQKDGSVNLSVQSAGFTFKPVAGLLFGEQPRGALGVEFAYWNRLELYGGMVFPKPVGFGGLGYRLDQIKWLSNTSAFIGMDTQKFINVGLLTRF